GGGRSTTSSTVSSTCSPGFAWPGTRPARTSAWACARLSASPRSTSSTSSRFFIPERLVSGSARREAGNDLGQNGRVGLDRGQPLVRPVRGLVRKRPCAVGSVREHVSVGVEDVVDDLEEQPELLREGTPR